LERTPHPLRVLVVDDEKYIRELFIELLSRQDCTVETAGDGEEALAKLREVEFDVMLSDVRMPRMDGFALLKTVKQAYPKLAVVMMTGFSQDYTIKEAVALGAEGYLPKPFRFDEVLIVLRQAREKAVSRRKKAANLPHRVKEKTEAA
jgi:two-component system response regulator PilR (NtrC family)